MSILNHRGGTDSEHSKFAVIGDDNICRAHGGSSY